MAHAETLAGRGALYAARSELVQTLRAVAETLDAWDGTREHETALARAMRALREARDFTPAGTTVAEVLDVEKIVDGHRTPVLKGENLDTMTCLVAQQMYLAYAQRQLAAAGGHLPAAARALYALGRIQAEMSRTTVDAISLHLPKAMTYYQAALLIDPRNPWAANELGVLLVRCGRAHDARDVLVHAAGPGCDPVVWHNLAIVHRRLGETRLAQQATQQWRQSVSRQAEDAAANQSADVRWVSPQQFMAAKPVLGL